MAGLVLVHYYINSIRKEGPNSMDYPKMMLFMGTVTQISSLFWKSIGLGVYSFTGSDYYFFHFIYLLMHSTSESAVVGLFVLIAFGWTLTFTSGKTFELFVPLSTSCTS